MDICSKQAFVSGETIFPFLAHKMEFIFHFLFPSFALNKFIFFFSPCFFLKNYISFFMKNFGKLDLRDTKK